MEQLARWKYLALVLLVMANFVMMEGIRVQPDLSTAQIVFPALCNRHGEVISNDLSEGDSRIKRHWLADVEGRSSDAKDNMHISIRGWNTDILLQLSPNSQLLTPNTVIEWYLETGKLLEKNLSRNCYYYGTDVKAEGPSLVAVSNCQGLSGYIRRNNESYFIEPLTDDAKILLQPSIRYETSSSNGHSYQGRNGEFEVLEAVNYGMGPLPHVMYRANLVLDKLNISIEHDEAESGNGLFAGWLENFSASRKGQMAVLAKDKVKRSNKNYILTKTSKNGCRKHRKKCLKEERKKEKRKKVKRKIMRNGRSQNSVKETFREGLLQNVHRTSQGVDWSSRVGDPKLLISPEVDDPKLLISPEVDDPKWLEVAVGVDHSVIAFHGEQNVEKFVLTLFNIVSAIYQDPSLGADLRIVLVRLIFYKDKKDSQVVEGSAKESLESVNGWASRLYHSSKPHLRHDTAVWLTKLDLGGPSGYAPVSGVCQPSRSCTLNRDEGLTSAFIIAHEIGHVLGLSHDGDQKTNNSCNLEGVVGSVMAPLVSATFGRFYWSPCSRLEYHRTVASWKCISNKPAYGNVTLMPSSIKYHYSLDDQCKLEFGDGYGLCRGYGISDPCTFLWCSNGSSPHLCKTKRSPPLEGTRCGDAKRCRNGLCERNKPMDFDAEMDQDHYPISPNQNLHDGWSPWSKWGRCSRTCGTGVRFRRRLCDRPKNKSAGSLCKGKPEEWQVCATDPCPEKTDLRAIQCSFLDYFAKPGQTTWLPFEPKHRKKKCLLSCYNPSTNEIFLGKEFLQDGTRCSYESYDDICIQGKCWSLGCDKVPNSKKRRDECGVCAGDGTTCRKNSIIFRDTISSKEYVEVAVIPEGAFKVMVGEEHPTTSFISLRDNSSNIVFNGDGKQEPAREFISEGAQFHYIRNGSKESLAAAGPLLRPVTILVHGGLVRQEVTISISYITSQPKLFYWNVGPLSSCSPECEIGFRYETLSCQSDKEAVPDDLCSDQPKPAIKFHPCKSDRCSTEWIAGLWEYCTATCGKDGIQNRVVSCVQSEILAGNGTIPKHSYSNRDHLSHETFQDSSGITIVGGSSFEPRPTRFVDPFLCRSDMKPESTKPCNRKPCPAYWKPTGWTECSVTCGSGHEERVYHCEEEAGNEVFYDCGPKPRELRVCFRKECASDCEDKSSFCDVPALHRYCGIRSFYKMCCETCSKWGF